MHFLWFEELPKIVVRALLLFIGKYAEAQPTVMFKSDNARELEAACTQMSWTPEPTLANRWPHNSVLECDIRSIQEVTRAVHLKAGFAIRPGLWGHSAVFATFVLNLKHNLAAREETRYVAATGVESPGRRLLLGQLVFYRVDPHQKEKFDPNATSGLFCGYGLDAGPESFKRVYLVLSYKKVKDGSPGCDMAVPVPFEELFLQARPFPFFVLGTVFFVLGIPRTLILYSATLVLPGVPGQHWGHPCGTTKRQHQEHT